MESMGPAPGDAAGVPRKTPLWRRIVAFLATFIFPGISQADDGEIRRGALWFLGVNASLIVGLLLAYAAIDRPWLSMGIVAAVTVVGLGFVLRLAIDGYRRERTPARRGPAKRAVAIYLVFLLGGLAFGSAIEAITEHLAKTYRIASMSMEPTLLRGDYLIVDKSAFKRGRHPRAGDIAIFIFPDDREKAFVKRIVAVPGDTVEIRRGKFLVNGKAIGDDGAKVAGKDDDAVAGRKKESPARRGNMARLRLAEGKYFMLGDNRGRSYDSRHFGPIDEKDLLGKPAFTYFSRDLSRVGRPVR